MSQNLVRMILLDAKSMTSELDRAGYKSMGISVRQVSKFNEAEDAIQKGHRDLIVINADYKKVDAAQVIKHLRSQDETKDIPIVVTKVGGSAQTMNKYIEAGADLFVEQPVSRDAFVEKIRHLLSQKIRTNDRIDFTGITARCYKKTGTSEAYEVKDISPSGMGLVGSESLPEGSEMMFEVLLPESPKPIRLTAKVSRVQDFRPSQYRVGVSFVSFESNDEHRLRQFLDHHDITAKKLAYYS